MALVQQHPRQKVNQNVLNLVRHNFLTYDDYEIFESGLPGILTKPLRQDQSNNPSKPHPKVLQQIQQLGDGGNEHDDHATHKMNEEERQAFGLKKEEHTDEEREK